MYPVLLLLLLPQIGVMQVEMTERVEAYVQARREASRAGKPLLNIGCPRTHSHSYPCGDVCIDLDAHQLRSCESSSPRVGDVRAIPFRSKYFGAVLCSHVLEHLPTVADAERATAEMQRVGDRVYVTVPKRWSIAAILHPEHHLWVDRTPDGQLLFEQR